MRWRFFPLVSESTWRFQAAPERKRAVAEEGIPILAVSTFDTDVLLVREGDPERAVAALGAAGWGVG